MFPLCILSPQVQSTASSMGEVFTFDGNVDDLLENYSYFSTVDPPSIDGSISSGAAPCKSEVVTTGFKYALASIYCLVCLLSLLGNSLVVLVVTYNRGNRSVTDIYLLNLAIADILFALSLPIWAVYRAHEWIFGTAMCKIVSTLLQVNFYSGILLLAAISIDRFLAIVYATRAATEKRHWVKFVCVGIWLFSLLLSLPIISSREAFQYSDPPQIVCYENIQGSKTSEWRVVLRILPQTFGFIIPLIIMLFCYGMTVHQLFQTKNSPKKKAMKIILAVVLFFLVCWLPYNVSLLVDTLLRTGVIADSCERRSVLDRAFLGTEILSFTHSCINPFIYAFIGQKFRNNFLKILVARGLISKETLNQYRKGSSFSSTSGNNSTTL
ncbi:C-X-C chemokine receptor type 1 [Varanus komodoensis]|nr:C-X-C chemokine receptor type 1 [Varanus komodoensis]